MKLLNRLTPFIAAGVFIVALVFGMVLLAYLFVFGAILGVAMYLINLIRDKFFSKKPEKQPAPKQPSGRIIDSNDWHKL